jgi:hypothetical protein
VARFWPGGGGRLAQEINHGLHLLRLYADEQRDVSAPQEAARARHPRHAVAWPVSRSTTGIVCVAHNGDDQFHGEVISETRFHRKPGFF